ncbi:MAG: GTP cyclohydrolase FolE2 [Ignavibacteria bacterium]
MKYSKHNSKSKLPDTQSKRDTRKIPIDRVGIKNLKYPIIVKDRDRGNQHTIATLSMTVDLPMHFKGTHMSRFVEILEAEKNEIYIDSIFSILEKMKKRLNAISSHIELSFSYFREKTAPVSKKKSLMNYEVRFNALIIDNRKDLILTVKVPVTTLCPCSKSIAKYGAHNQRGEAIVSIRFKGEFWIEELIDTIESSASSDLITLLKREDEKFVTEKAYENPVFVEDFVRNIAIKLKRDSRIIWYHIEAENYESIHSHNAYAMIESPESFSNGYFKDFLIKKF